MDYRGVHRAGPGFARSSRFAGLALLLVALGAAVYVWPYTVDDAFIAARYARHLARGEGYAFNAGAVSDGVTGPLWLLPLTLAGVLGLSPIVAAKGSGLVCVLAACLRILAHAERRGADRLETWLLAALLASASALWAWSIAGLETGAATLLVTWMLVAVEDRAAHQVGTCGALLFWLRPELAPVSMLALGWLAAREVRGVARAMALLCAGAMAVLLFRKLSFGHWLPLSAYAKPPLLSNGAGYVAQSASTWSALVVGAPLLVGIRPALRQRALWVAVLICHACAVLLAGGDWMPAARLFVPVVPVACACVATLLANLLRRSRLLGSVTLGCALLARLLHGAAELQQARAAGLLREQRLPELLAALQHVASPIAMIDIGAYGYASTHTLIDLAGLTDDAIAHSAGGHVSKRISSRWLEQRAPCAIVLHSTEPPRVDDEGRLRWFAGHPVERNVLAMRWVLERYRVQRVIAYAAHYHYVIMTPQSQNEQCVKP